MKQENAELVAAKQCADASLSKTVHVWDEESAGEYRAVTIFENTLGGYSVVWGTEGNGRSEWTTYMCDTLQDAHDYLATYSLSPMCASARPHMKTETLDVSERKVIARRDDIGTIAGDVI